MKVKLNIKMNDIKLPKVGDIDVFNKRKKENNDLNDTNNLYKRKKEIDNFKINSNSFKFKNSDNEKLFELNIMKAFDPRVLFF
jgi:hypothetical protein